MPEIKTLDELKALRDKYKGTINLRSAGSSENKARIAVGMATCGIASGARETINAIADEVKKQGLSDVAVVQTGCMGNCYAEPIVEIRLADREAVVYCRIDAEKGRALVNRHVKNGEIVEEWTLEKAGNKR